MKKPVNLQYCYSFSMDETQSGYFDVILASKTQCIISNIIDLVIYYLLDFPFNMCILFLIDHTLKDTLLYPVAIVLQEL
jgi:hypothetical protein